MHTCIYSVQSIHTQGPAQTHPDLAESLGSTQKHQSKQRSHSNLHCKGEICPSCYVETVGIQAELRS